MTDTIPDLTIPGHSVAELRVRVDVLNKVLADLVDRTVPADSESADSELVPELVPNWCQVHNCTSGW